jgi:HTH-type transcriptional regulator/antitoxin HigA
MKATQTRVIHNERAYRNTMDLVRRFEQALADVADGVKQLDPQTSSAVTGGYQRHVDELTAELDYYDALRNGDVDTFTVADFASLGEALIAARIARGWTQADLARAIGVRPQQVQRWEAREYGTTTLERIGEVAKALGVKVGEVSIGSAAAEREPLRATG